MTIAYPLEQLRSEVAFVAYHFHWTRTEILSMAHRERVEWVGEISKINKRVMDEAGG